MLRWYRSLPENVRMVGTAIIGASIGFLTYKLIYYVMPLEPKATVSWVFSYLIGIARQHALHRVLTFSEKKVSYWVSLKRAYVMYLGSMLFGTGLDYLLTEKLGIEHQVAWFACLISTALISFFLLKRFVFRTQGD